MARSLARVPPCWDPLLLVLVLLALVAALLRPDAAAAQGALPRYEVTGFRAARFGMREPEVREIAHQSFGVDEDRMTLVTDETAGTTRLIVHVPMLERGVGAGRVEYLFGDAEHRLFQVNVVWGLDTNPLPSNLAMLTGAVRLQRHFLGFTWAIHTLQTGIPLDDRAILLFGGVDDRNGAVSVVLENVRYEFVAGNIRLMPEPAVPSTLTLSYVDQGRVADLRSLTRRTF
jgi:hypothetical protein